MDHQIAAARRMPARQILTALTWLVVNVVFAYLLLYPLGLAELILRHVLAGLLDAPWSPFEGDPVDLQAAVVGTVLLGVPLLGLVVAVNRGIRRTRGVWFWPATTVVLVAPTVVSGVLNLTLAEAFGQGVLW
ncbi:hypothetical protein [Kribbella italica]|uniref:Uncharacterized protein n=1 Tax=Kribbella italica TaxID=1540520 RepID=A0A7W9MS20_9ACTN|nr:hypothetical protein [Kribbella italica]MBB5834134.1 hypothetical protein [Kribbella italica]